jgi:hypothetical protein
VTVPTCPFHVHEGILSRVDLASGEDQPGAIRLAVAVAAVVSHGDVPRLLPINRLKEPVAASAAIAGRDLFLRGEKSLYRLAEPGK